MRSPWGSPWRGVITWCSSHPLLAKRLQVLSHYAEQLDLDSEYNLIISRNQISIATAKKRGWFFYLEIFVWLLPLWTGLISVWWTLQPTAFLILPWYKSFVIEMGVGLLFRSGIQILGQRRLKSTTVLTLLSDIELSPIWSTTVDWQGKLRIVQASIWGFPKLYFHDRTGVMPVAYPFWYRWIPPFRSALTELEAFTESFCQVRGEVVRGLSPQLRINHLQDEKGQRFNGFPNLIRWLLSFGVLIIGALLPG